MWLCATCGAPGTPESAHCSSFAWRHDRNVGGRHLGAPSEEHSRGGEAGSVASSDVTQHPQQSHAHLSVHSTGFPSPQSSAVGSYGGGHPLYPMAAPGSQPPVPYGQPGGMEQYSMTPGMGSGYVVYYDGRMQQQMPPPHMMRAPQPLYPHQVHSWCTSRVSWRHVLIWCTTLSRSR